MSDPGVGAPARVDHAQGSQVLPEADPSASAPQHARLPAWMLLWGEFLSSSVEIRFLAVRSHEDGEFSVNDFRCLWAVYRHEELLPEDLADMIRRVSGGLLCVQTLV